MSLEQLDLLYEKVQKALDTIRVLKTERQHLQNECAQQQARVVELEAHGQGLQHELNEANATISGLHDQNEQLNQTIENLHLQVNEKEGKISAASEKLLRVMSSLEEELIGDGSNEADHSSEDDSALELEEHSATSATSANSDEYEYVEYEEEYEQEEDSTRPHNTFEEDGRQEGLFSEEENSNNPPF
jgi:FtsZ-binding cell division protein ZapB